MELEKSKTISFSGYRPQKFDFPLSSNDMYESLVQKTLIVIIKSAESGYCNYIIGCAPGFDIICGELTRFAKKSMQIPIKLICALPYEDFINSKHFNKEWRSRLNSLIDDSDYVINTTGKYNAIRGSYQRRNIFMINNSSKLICYYSGKKGGTANTVQYAQDNGLEIVNMAELILY